jgi:hypothetical protein
MDLDYGMVSSFTLFLLGLDELGGSRTVRLWCSDLKRDTVSISVRSRFFSYSDSGTKAGKLRFEDVLVLGY